MQLFCLNKNHLTSGRLLHRSLIVMCGGMYYGGLCHNLMIRNYIVIDVMYVVLLLSLQLSLLLHYYYTTTYLL